MLFKLYVGTGRLRERKEEKKREKIFGLEHTIHHEKIPEILTCT